MTELFGYVVAAAAEEWLGTPYHHQARGPKGEAVDCVGLLIGVAQELELIVGDYDPTGYDWETDGSQLQVELSKWAELVAEAESPVSLDDWEELIEPGDIGVFRVAGMPQHTAFFTRKSYGLQVLPVMIHASNSEGSVVSHRMDRKWSKRLFQLWRLKGVQNG